MQERLERLRHDLNRFLYGYNKILFNFLTDSTQKIELAKVYKDFSELFSHQIFEQPKQISSTATSPQKDYIHRIESGLIHYYLESNTSDLIASLKKSLWAKKEFRTLLNPINREASLKALNSLAKELDYLTPQFEELWKIWIEALQSINCQNLNTFASSYLNNAHLEAKNIANYIISSAYKIYTILLERYANSLGLTANELTYSNIIDALNFADSYENLPDALALKCLGALLEDLKINHLLDSIKYSIPSSLEKAKNVPCDIICPLIPIDNIYIFIAPSPNFSFYKKIFYIFGKAAIYAATSENTAMEHIHFGDPSIKYGYAYLFDLILDYKYFQRSYFAPKQMSIPAEKLLFAKLTLILKIAAEALYENRIINSPLNLPFSNLALDYTSLMKSILQIDVPSSYFLFNRDHHFKAIHALRGIAFALLFTHHLQSKFGLYWFSNKKAGYAIIELLECGTTYSINELIKDWGFNQLNIELNYLIDLIYSGSLASFY